MYSDENVRAVADFECAACGGPAAFNEMLGRVKCMESACGEVSRVSRPFKRLLVHKQGELEYIYFIQGGEYTKIGITKNLRQRFGNLQSHNPGELELLAAFPIVKPDKGRYLERRLHRIFTDYQVRGEWFRLPDWGTEYITELNKLDYEVIELIANMFY